MTDLMPCPFCGSTDIDPSEWMSEGGNGGPGCSDCGATAETPERWNTRAYAAEIEAMKAKLDSVSHVWLDNARLQKERDEALNTIETQRAANVLAVRSSHDAPGFDACVASETIGLSDALYSIEEIPCWQPIETAPTGEEVWLAAWIVPSEEAQRNGSKPFWDVTQGMKLPLVRSWTGILGGDPSYWMPIVKPEPPKAPSPSPAEPL